MKNDNDSAAFDVVLPDGRSIRVEVEPTRTAQEIAEVIAQKAGLRIGSAEHPELYAIATDQTLAGFAGDLLQRYTAGEKIGFRVGMAS